MVATSQETAAAAGDTGALPESNKNPAEPQTVPLAALAEERAKKREASERADKLEAELAKLQAQLNSKNGDSKAAANPAQDSNERLRKLEEAERRRGLSSELGLDDKQTIAVMKVMQDAPNLNAMQALQVAKFNDEKLFQAQAADNTHPAMSGSLGTSRGAQPQPPVDDTKARWAYMDKVRNTDQVKFDEVKNNLIGSYAAKAMGLPHQLIPIPKA